LAGITDRFSGHKVVSLQFAGETMPDNLERYGDVLEINPPKARLRVNRTAVPEMLSRLLAEQTIEDVSVEDPPLEEVIADVFLQIRQDQDDAAKPPAALSSSRS
jgi:ABC-2 type transport system ATP-binding protein